MCKVWLIVQVGALSLLNLKKPAQVSTSVTVPSSVSDIWKLDDTVDDEIIDSDQLLDQDDFKKPDPASLKGRLLFNINLLYRYFCINYFK